jgi:hypothetical protein
MPRKYYELIRYHPQVRYPHSAVLAGYTGVGLYRVHFDAAGKATRVEVLRSAGIRRSMIAASRCCSCGRRIPGRSSTLISRLPIACRILD